jgi:hypothetical protein
MVPFRTSKYTPDMCGCECMNALDPNVSNPPAKNKKKQSLPNQKIYNADLNDVMLELGDFVKIIFFN